MKKIMPALIVITVLVCTLTSCFLFESFELMYDESEISKIQIVKLLEYDESKGEYNIEIISTVKNNSEFLSEFKSVESHSFIGDPVGVYEGDVVIKFTYKNGEYEISKEKETPPTAKNSQLLGLFAVALVMLIIALGYNYCLTSF